MLEKKPEAGEAVSQSPEIRLESYLKRVQLIVQEAALAKYPTLDEASNKASELRSMLIDISKEYNLLQIIIEVSGPGVYIPNIDMDTTASDYLTLTFNKKKFLSPTPLLESQKGFLDAYALRPIENEDGSFSATVSMVLKDANDTTITLGDETGTYPVARLQMSQSIYIALEQDVEISIPQLEAHRDRIAALSSISMSRKHQSLVPAFNKLAAALYRERSENFVVLRHIDILHSIAQEAKKAAELDDEEELVDALRRVIGVRALTVEGSVFSNFTEESQDRSVNGNLLDILPYDPQSREKIPTLAIEGESSEIVYAPLSEVRSFHF